MRKRKHSQFSRRNARLSRRRKKLTRYALVIGILMAASIIGAAYTNRAADPFANTTQSASKAHGQSLPAPSEPQHPVN